MLSICFSGLFILYAQILTLLRSIFGISWVDDPGIGWICYVTCYMVRYMPTDKEASNGKNIYLFFCIHEQIVPAIINPYVLTLSLVNLVRKLQTMF